MAEVSLTFWRSMAPAGPGVDPWRLARRWALATVAGVASAGLALVLAGGLPWSVAALAVAAAVLAALVMLAGLRRSGAPFAPCSRVTLLRAGLVAALAGLLAAPSALAAPWLAWTALAAALLALALDGLDGWLARRRGEATAFGARFDMEVDAALALVLAGLALGAGKAGVWVLALGLMRYGFVAASLVWPWLSAPLPESLRRKTVCVLQVAVLAVLLVPGLEPPLSGLVAAAALALLVWSFAVDVLWLHRARAGRTTARRAAMA